jgi:light-regulated signal transduction histidine kinase (bacteriophytochrome)
MVVMSSAIEPASRDIVAQTYTSVLSAYLSGAGEDALAQAYELGRKAASQGVGVLEMSMVHHEALVHVLSTARERPTLLLVLEAARFFAESLAPFEMTLRADVAVRQARAAAETAHRELESFSYSVAHDLRAPLRSIDGFSQALVEDCAEQLNGQGREYLRYIRESAQRMGHLIDDLLALSRVSRAELHRMRVDMSLLARSVLERLQATDRQRAVSCLIQDDVWAIGDARLLRVVLENLLGNAWKFTSKEPQARIEFGALADRQGVVYCVRDNGAGFDVTYAGKLFGVFQRLHSAEEFEGTGIGLATVQRIVRRHGGRVWAEGEVDRGASFYFTLAEENVNS